MKTTYLSNMGYYLYAFDGVKKAFIAYGAFQLAKKDLRGAFNKFPDFFCIGI